MNPKRRRIYSDSEGGSGGSQILSLSLFIMLLAFFILLNAKSNFEDDKIKPVVSSVAQSFSSKIAQDMQNKPSVTASAQLGAGEGDVIAHIEGLFKAEITSSEVTANRQRGVIVIRIPRAEFETVIAEFSAGQVSSNRGKKLLSTLASILRSEQRGHPWRMDITFYTRDNPARLQNTEPQQVADLLKSTTASADTLERAGVPTQLMSVGVQRGDVDWVDLYFRPETILNPDGEGGNDGR